MTCLNNLIKFKEDAVEKFERMQREIMSNDFESVPFNAARMRNDRKVKEYNKKIFTFIRFLINENHFFSKHTYYDALDRANHHYLTPNNRIGTPLRKVANPPPGKLSVY